jgi:hypothetical protein
MICIVIFVTYNTIGFVYIVIPETRYTYYTFEARDPQTSFESVRLSLPCLCQH